MVPRQHRRPNRACTKPTRRFSVQRGFGSAPAVGGLAASCWAAQTFAPSTAAMSGQRGRRCADTAAPRGRVRCSRAASPSPSAGGGRCALQRAWRRPLVRCRAGQESARGCEHAGQSGPGGASLPPSDPSAHNQFVAPVRAKPLKERRHVVTGRHPAKQPNHRSQTGYGLASCVCPPSAERRERDLDGSGGRVMRPAQRRPPPS